MDVVGTVSFMAAAYGYYKAGIYVADTVDKSIRVYTFCKNAVGYIRRPIRHYFDSDNESEDSYPDIPPRPASCSDLDREFNYVPKNENDSELDVRSDPGVECFMSKTIANLAELKGNRRDSSSKKKNRETSISMCSEATEMCIDDILPDVSWVLVKNPDYD